MKEIKAYKCEYCGKLLQVSHAMQSHECGCKKNPCNFRNCFHCHNLTKKEAEIYSGYDSYYGCEPVNIKMSFLYCNAKNIFLYTPSNEHKGNFSHTDNEGGNFENYPMPLECELFLDNRLPY